MDDAALLVVTLSAAAAAAGYIYSRRDRSYPVAERLPEIERAISFGQDLEMEYFTNSSKRFSTRKVRPIEISQQYGRPYLRAFDYWRKDERTFRVSRIKSISVVPKRDTAADNVARSAGNRHSDGGLAKQAVDNDLGQGSRIVKCQQCGQALRVRNGKARAVLRCPRCRHEFSVELD